jgi:hypothetical protein
MTEIRFLPENSAPSTEDWLVVQRTSGETEKIQIQNLPIVADTTAIESEIDDLQTQINDKATANHGHFISDIDGLESVLDNKADKSTVTNLQGQINSKADNTTLATTVSVLQLEINGKAPSVHGHQISDVTGLQSALDAKLPSGTIINGFDYNQQTLPNNPTTGQTWRERDSNNWIIRDWFWDGQDWQSIQEFILTYGTFNGQSSAVETASTSTANDTYRRILNFPPFLSNGNKGIYFKETVFHLGIGAGGNGSTLTDYWRITPAYIQTGTHTNLNGQLFTSELIQFRNYERWLTHNLRVYRSTFTDTNLSGISFQLRSFGSPGQLIWSANVSYRLIRQSS